MRLLISIIRKSPPLTLAKPGPERHGHARRSAMVLGARFVLCYSFVSMCSLTACAYRPPRVSARADAVLNTERRRRVKLCKHRLRLR